MELTFYEQSAAFGLSLVLGLMLGALYGVFRLFRIITGAGRKITFACDIAYMLICSLCCFFLSLGYIRGFVRIYIILGAAGGAVLYRLTLGRLLGKLFVPFIGRCRKLFFKIERKVKIFVKKLLKFAAGILYNIFVGKDKKKAKAKGNKNNIVEKDRKDEKRN